MFSFMSCSTTPAKRSRRDSIYAGLTTTKHAELRLIRSGPRSAARHLELSVPNTRKKFTAGQWVFLCIPALGLLHWHPFTISSSGFDKKLTLHFACTGKWTSQVAALAEHDNKVKVSRCLRRLCFFAPTFCGGPQQ
jgi:predicted ferric reductase